MIKAHPTENRMARQAREPETHVLRCSRYATWHDSSDMMKALQAVPRDAELLPFEAGCEDYCEREVDEYLGPETRPSARPGRVP